MVCQAALADMDCRLIARAAALDTIFKNRQALDVNFQNRAYPNNLKCIISNMGTTACALKTEQLREDLSFLPPIESYHDWVVEREFSRIQREEDFLTGLSELLVINNEQDGRLRRFDSFLKCWGVGGLYNLSSTLDGFPGNSAHDPVVSVPKLFEKILDAFGELTEDEGAALWGCSLSTVLIKLKTKVSLICDDPILVEKATMFFEQLSVVPNWKQFGKSSKIARVDYNAAEDVFNDVTDQNYFLSGNECALINEWEACAYLVSLPKRGSFNPNGNLGLSPYDEIARKFGLGYTSIAKQEVKHFKEDLTKIIKMIELAISFCNLSPKNKKREVWCEVFKYMGIVDENLGLKTGLRDFTRFISGDVHKKARGVAVRDTLEAIKLRVEEIKSVGEPSRILDWTFADIYDFGKHTGAQRCEPIKRPRLDLDWSDDSE